MSDADPLDALSSAELHDLAVRHAKRHLDVGFFIRLMKTLPIAEAAAGEIDEAEADVMSLSAHIDDVTDSGRGEVAELMRPFYLEYLRDTASRRPPSRPTFVHSYSRMDLARRHGSGPSLPKGPAHSCSRCLGVASRFSRRP